METLKILKKDFISFIGQKVGADDYKTVGPVRKGIHYVFAELESVEDLCLDYDVTLLPPKKYFQPPREALLSYVPRQPGSYKAVNRSDPIALIGVHYYDLAGIYLMDKTFSDEPGDQHYLQKRKNSVLVGIHPTGPYKYRFARSVTRGQSRKVADVMLVSMGEELVVEILTPKGKEYMAGAKTVKNDYSALEIEEARNSIKDDQKMPVPIELVPDYLAANYQHPAWKHYDEKCFGCGSCVFVCPTCYCFDVKDEMDLSLESGERVRIWDGCMLEDFAAVADGHNFRQRRGDRFRHRMFRKGKFFPERYGYFGCVGCGRCADACTADIAGPAKVLKYMEDHKESGR